MKLFIKSLSILLFISVSLFCNAQITRSLKSFGLKGDGVTDDTNALIKAMVTAQNGTVLDGENFTYLILKPIDLSLQSLVLKNVKFVVNKRFVNQTFKISSNNITFDNIFLDGGRGTYKKGYEKWNVFSSENSVESIYPDEPDFFFFVGLDKDANFNITRFTVNNLHAASAITIITFGNVNFKELNFSNLSNKSFHVYHSVDDGKTQSGTTHVSNAKSDNVGLLSEKVMVNNQIYDRASIKYMPQGSFNFIVSFGNYFFDNLYVHNYGSSGVTSDRNLNFIGNYINVVNDCAKTISNNPSGAVWFENTKNVRVDKIDVNILNRDPRDFLFDSSAISLFSVDNIVNIGEINIASPNIPVLNKGFKASLSGNNVISINKLDIKGSYKQAGGIFSTMPNVPIESQINIGTLKYNNNQTFEFYGMKNVSVDEVIGDSGQEKLNFKLPFSIQSKEKYIINKTNLKQIYLSDHIKKVNIIKPVEKITFLDLK